MQGRKRYAGMYVNNAAYVYSLHNKSYLNHNQTSFFCSKQIKNTFSVGMQTSFQYLKKPNVIQAVVNISSIQAMKWPFSKL